MYLRTLGDGGCHTINNNTQVVCDDGHTYQVATAQQAAAANSPTVSTRIGAPIPKNSVAPANTPAAAPGTSGTPPPNNWLNKWLESEAIPDSGIQTKYMLSAGGFLFLLMMSMKKK